ncbi:hypothetical protein FORC36_4728 (plasmid) [Vibrio vulnificus]|uniref:hypothetical protein n=1 Tax=Vibrio vulnificus TaxID=672 RepID=UPI000A2021AA|nr:hypothetical protein [Vibrio vulnificus]ARN69245.1 hypothetical protein FORC36_4728 [Vibrio vulnificus]MBE4205086.1 hypothetical protein [Vibrio parahaemolyticus]
MTSKIFSLVASKITKDEFKEFKKEANSLLEKFVGRTLNPSKLNELSSALLGATDSNVFASMFKRMSVEDIIDLYKSGALNYAESSEDKKQISKFNIIPLLDFKIRKERVTMGVEIFCQSTDSGNEAVSLGIFVNAPDSDYESNDESELASLSDNGGDMLHNMLRSVYTSSESDLYSLFSSYGAKETPLSVTVSPVIAGMYGLNSSSFGRFSSFEKMEDYLNTCLIMIASDLNARFGAKGKAMAIRISPAYTSKFCVEISQ